MFGSFLNSELNVVGFFLKNRTCFNNSRQTKLFYQNHFLEEASVADQIYDACLRIIFRNESQTVLNSPLRSSSPTLNLINQPTKSL